MDLRILWLLLLVAVTACATYRNDLNRGQRLYEESEYERALAIWRFLEPDVDSLRHADQARYAYLRGMTDYRLGGGRGGAEPAFRAHARHWLAIAKAIEQSHPGALPGAWQQLLDEALSELNAEIYGLAAPSGGQPAADASPSVDAPPSADAPPPATAPR